MNFFLESIGVRSRINNNVCTVLAVVVLYKKTFDAVPSAARIRHWLDETNSISTALKLAHCLIYDNSPVPHSREIDDSHKRISVFHDEFNGGTRAAYLYALQLAFEKGCSWILLLDHDTDVPIDFFEAVDAALATACNIEKIGAVVPYVFDRGYQISPSRITKYGRGYAKNGAWKTPRRNTTLTAIASATLVRADALESILPIPLELKLDHLDHWIFRELQKRGCCIVVSAARVEHSLSVQSMKTLDVNRYRSILDAELVYLKSDAAYSVVKHLMWHVIRCFKILLVVRRMSLFFACVGGLLKILKTDDNH